MRFDAERTGQRIRIDSYGPAHAYQMERIPNGVRIEAPDTDIGHFRAIRTNSTFYVDVTSAGKNDIAVTVRHFLAWESDEPRFELSPDPAEMETEETADSFILTAGDMRVTLSRRMWHVRFEMREGDGWRQLTEIVPGGIRYHQYDKRSEIITPCEDYQSQHYQPYLSVTLAAEPGETYYGLGERFTPFVKNGQSVTMWNEDQFTNSQFTYVNVPLYLSSSRYAFFADHTAPVSFEMNTADVRAVQVSVPGEVLRFHVIGGRKPADLIDAYTALTGRPALPPKWSFGYWFSTCSDTTWNEDTCHELLDGFAERKIPVDVLHIDGPWLRPNKWCDFVADPAVFKDLPAALAGFRKRGLKLCAWINPYVGQGCEMFYEGVEKGYFLMRADGRGVKQTDGYWMPGQVIVDLTNPEAYRWWQGKVEDMIDAGFDSFKTDFGEKLPTDVKYYNGADPMGMHNYYTYLYNRCVFEALEKKRGIGEAVLFARSGTAGSQKFPCNWAGDPSGNYASMAETLRGGLSYAMSGFAFWSHDIGGFFNGCSADLYKRWVQFGFLSSHTRTHWASDCKVPWKFDEESGDVLRCFDELKCALMPYLYQAAVDAHLHGTPVLRPMTFEFPDDLCCRYQDLQYMLGGALLAAPIFNDRSTAAFYLPVLPDGGKWWNLLDGEILPAGQYERTYDYFHMPLFVRGNTLLPMGGRCDTADYDYADGTTVRWVLPADAEQPKPITIPGDRGETVCTIRAERDGGRFVFRAEGRLENAAAEVILEDGTILSAAFENGTAVIEK